MKLTPKLNLQGGSPRSKSLRGLMRISSRTSTTPSTSGFRCRVSSTKANSPWITQEWCQSWMIQQEDKSCKHSQLKEDHQLLPLYLTMISLTSTWILIRWEKELTSTRRICSRTSDILIYMLQCSELDTIDLILSLTYI